MDERCTSVEYAQTQPDVVWIEGVPWRLRSGILSPIAMPHLTENICRQSVRRALAESGALLARWADQWNTGTETEWYWVCCDDKDYDVETISSSRGRRSVRKGLRQCDVRIIENRKFASLAYPLFRLAQEKYHMVPLTESEYRSQIEQVSQYPGTVFWGAFVQDRLAAFSTCLIMDNAVALGSTKSDPELHGCCPNNALFYTIAKHYLSQTGISYVTNGSRTLLHPTTINDFLERMGYRRIHARLNVVVSPKARLLQRTGIAAWGKALGLPRFFPEKWERLQGFRQLMQIAETFHEGPR